jgi:hypothetical protein
MGEVAGSQSFVCDNVVIEDEQHVGGGVVGSSGASRGLSGISLAKRYDLGAAPRHLSTHLGSGVIGAIVDHDHFCDRWIIHMRRDNRLEQMSAPKGRDHHTDPVGVDHTRV